MATATNALFFLALVASLGVTYVHTSRLGPEPDVRAGWPFRRFWVSAVMRRLSLFVATVTALLGLVAAIGSGVWAERFRYQGPMFGAAVALATTTTLALAYTIALYWRNSAPKPHGF